MSNTNNTMQTQTSNALHNAIMEAGGKDHPPMLAPDNYVQWKSRIKRYIDTKPYHELIRYCLLNLPYEYKWTEKAVPVAEEPATITKDDEMSKEKEIDKLMALISSCSRKSTNLPTTTFELHQIPVELIKIIHQESTEECGRVSMECQKPKRAKDEAYHKKKMLLCKQEEAGVQLNTEQADWKDDTDDESDDQELKAHYMYMAQIHKVTLDIADNFGPIFDTEPLQKELESIFGHLFDEYFNEENQVVSKSFAVTTVDTSDKHQQQPDLTSSTSTLAITVTADGNFD
nr:hypothetical protein [Tanacetum cinerariifolium]